MVLPADRSSATVIIEESDYHLMLAGMMDSDTSAKLTGDLPTKLYNIIRPTGSKVPTLYSLPKIHKDQVPLQPIVSCTGSPSYQLSRLMAQLITCQGFRTLHRCS